jgi:cathepsin D
MITPIDSAIRYWGTPQLLSTQEIPGGQFTLGGVNSSLFTGQINYVGLSDVNWWTIPMDSVVVGGHEITLTGNVKNAIIDTGTTLVGEW